DEETITLVLAVIRKLSVDDRDFTRIVVEVVSEIRTAAEDEGEDSDAMMESKLRCLVIARGSLETLQHLEEQSPMEAVLSEVIIPAMQASEPALRESGVRCLGLFCVLDKARAADFMPLFIHGVRNGHAELQLKSLQISFDLIMLYGMEAMAEKLSDVSEIFSLISDCSEHSDNDMQAVAVEGVSKLLLAGVLTDSETLQSLILLYFHPSTYGNNQLRQCLTFFFQLFCFSKESNQQALRQVAVSCLLMLAQVHDDLDATLVYAMVTPLQIGQQLIDWMNPTKMIRSDTSGSAPVVSFAVYGDFAIELLKTALQESQTNCKLMVQLVNKLIIDESVPRETLKELSALTKKLQEARRSLSHATASDRVGDATTRRTLEKLRNAFSKLVPVDAEETPVSAVDELDELLNSDLDEGEATPPAPKKRAVTDARSSSPTPAETRDEIDQLLDSDMSE
ncbi:nuclear condensing complex subunit, C-term domain-containing protein, partial [Thamnocephalis sphaerospora]